MLEITKTKEFFRILFQKGSDALFLVEEPDLRIVEANDEMGRLLGYSREELLALRVPDLVPPDRRHLIPSVQGSITEERPVDRSRRQLLRKDGTAVLVDHQITRMVLDGRVCYVASARDVTDQVRAEEALREAHADLERRVRERTAELRESDERYRLVARASGTGIWDYDVRSGALFLSPIWKAQIGYEDHELPNAYETWASRIHPDDLGRIMEQNAREFEGRGAEYQKEFRLRHKDGSYRWIHAHAMILRDGAGKPVRVLGTHVDVTEARRAGEARRDSEERYRRLVEFSPDAVLVHVDGEIVFVNPAGVRLLGAAGAQEVVGRNIMSVVHPESRELVTSRLKRLREERLALPLLAQKWVRLDGTALDVEVGAVPLTYQDKPAVQVISRDLSERLRREEALRESEERFRQLAENIHNVFYVAAPDHSRMLYISAAYEEVWGRSRESLYRDPWSWMEAVHPDDRDRVRAGVPAGPDSTHSMEYRVVRPDGSVRWVFDWGKMLSDPEGRPQRIVGFAEDVTARKQAEEELRQAHADLERRVEERTAALTGEIAERRRTEEDLRLYREIFAHANDAILLLSPDGVVLAHNEAHRRLLGYPAAEIIGKTPSVWSPEDFRPILRAIETEGSFRGEIPNVTRSGERKVVELSAFPVRNASGGVLCTVTIKRDVTARKASEDALRQSMARSASLAEELSLLLAHTRDFVYRHDTAGVFTYLSPSVEQITGYSARDWLAHYTKYLTDNPVNQKVIEYTEETLRTGRQSPPYLVEIFHRDGRRILLEVNENAYREGGRVAGVVGVARDVTERKRAERRMAAQHEVTRALAESATLREAAPRLLRTVCEALEWDVGVLWTVAAGGDALRCVDLYQRPAVNATAFAEVSRSFLFRPGVGLPGRVWSGREPAWIRDVVGDANFPRAPYAAKDGLHGAFGFPILLGGQVLGVAEFFSREIRQPDADLLDMVASVGSQVGQFIERQRAEEALRFQKTLLESQSEAAIDGILVVSREGKMISFNRRFVEMWDLPADVVESRSDEAAMRSIQDKLSHPESFQARVKHLYENPDEESRDEISLKDGRTFDRYSAPIQGLDGVHYGRVWFFRDVTGRMRTEVELRRAAEETRRAYEDLKQAQEQLIRSEKLASIGMLVSGVAHEINNPLNVMYGNLQLLAQAPGLPKKGARARGRRVPSMIRDALKAAQHARRIVEDFRSYARDTRTAEPVDLNVCLEETLALFRRGLRPGIRLVKELRPLPPVRCFRGQINQVFLNLLNNAEEAIERRGTITLRTRRKEGRATVEVADTGRGMPEEVRRKLFEPFFTTKPVGKGLGLGLSISAMIVHNHRGQISVKSRPGRGALFRVELPLEES